MDANRERFCLLLHAQPQLGLRTSNQLLRRFADAPSFWSAPCAELPRPKSPTVRSALQELWRGADSAEAWGKADRWQAQLKALGVRLLDSTDAGYPALLRDVPDRPEVLYVQGDVDALVVPQLAIVGSRAARRASLALAEQFAEALAAGGFGICSGLALGVDGAAHQGALAAGGRTIAVLGSGVDRIYPARHRGLATQIAARGALISEYPPGTPPRAGHFPRRNRIIAGVSCGTLVIEAARRSGSLITARLALDYNREVFAVPGSPLDPSCQGNHELIRQGAKLVESAVHVVEELEGWLQLMGAVAAAEPQSASAGAVLAGELDAILQAVDFGPTALDTILARSGCPAERLSGYLLELELGRWVESQGGLYRRCR